MQFQKISILYHGQLLGFPKGGGTYDYGILRAWGVFTIGNPKAWGDFTGGFHRGDVCSRKCRVSSLKMLSVDYCGLL